VYAVLGWRRLKISGPKVGKFFITLRFIWPIRILEHVPPWGISKFLAIEVAILAQHGRVNYVKLQQFSTVRW